MRHAGFIAAALLILACGPDPNAKLPFSPTVNGGAGGATGNGGATSAGGSTTQPGSGGRTTTVSGGATGRGGVTSSGGRTTTRVGTGGATGAGGATDEGGTGGSTRVGTGGRTSGTGGRTTGSGGSTTTRRDGGEGGVGGTDGGVDRPVGSGGARGSGGAPGIDGGGGDEPCVPAATVTGSGSANSGNFGTTGPYCFRTPDNITGWNCSNFTGRTLKVNNVAVTCGGTTPGTMPLPAKINGYYYFDASGGTGAVEYASIYWY